MKNGSIRRIIYLALLLGLLVVTKYFAGIGKQPASAESEAFRTLPIQYTRHADCRMECRTISEAEVRHALEHGTINQRKSDPADQPCPTLALEDHTDDGQHVRIIFAHCEGHLKVVTAIDLEGEYECSCP